jgi:hypothetical protein
LGEDRPDEEDTRPSQWNIAEHERYRTLRLGAPAKFIILHSEIGRRVDFARVRYGTMPSESMRSNVGAPWRDGDVVGGCIRDPRTKTSYASCFFFGKLAVQSS